MLKTALLALMLPLLAAGPKSGDGSDAAEQRMGLKQSRDSSCGGSYFQANLDAKGEGGYTHRRIGLSGATKVGDAILEWCQSAQNAVIYFYVDDPGSPQHKDCPENMSIALFPGEGANSRKIIDDNIESYDDPAVRVVEAPHTGDIEIDSGGRKIAAHQLEGVFIDPVGKPRRHRMIGYARGDDFVRIMTGTVDTPSCRNETAKAFLAKLTWP